MNRRSFQGGRGGTCVRKAGVVYCSGMSTKQKKPPKREKTEKEPRRKTPTFLLELPLEVDAGQAKRIRGHLEAGRQFYNPNCDLCGPIPPPPRPSPSLPPPTPRHPRP